MLPFLLAVHFVLTITIIGLILLQKHDSDGALGSGGGAAGGVFSVRGQANILTRSTAVLMTIFILNCLLMAKLAKKEHSKESAIGIIDEDTRENTAPAAPPKKTAPVTPSTPPANVPTGVPAAPVEAPEGQ